MSDERRADLGRWEIRSQKQDPDPYFVHPDRPWEHLLHFPDVDARFESDCDPEFWGDLTEREFGEWHKRAEFIAARVLCDVQERPSVRQHRDETGVNFVEGPNVWFMSSNKAEGRALMHELAVAAEAYVDGRAEGEDGETRLADSVRAEQERVEQRAEVHRRVERITAGFEGMQEWVRAQLASHDTHEARMAWLDQVEADVYEQKVRQMAQQAQDPTEPAEGETA